MVLKKIYWVMLFLIIGIAASSCGPVELESATQNQSIETNEPSITPLGNQDITVEDPTEIETPQPDPGYAAYWSEAVDDRTGIRFSVPCFWEVQLPTLDPNGLGAFFVRNYNDEFVLSHPRGIVLGSRAIKIDFIYIQGASTGLPTDATLRDVAEILGDESTVLLSTEGIVINGQEALRFTSRGTFDESPNQSYLFRLDGDLYLLFSVYPGEEILNTDVQGILNSIALTSEASVQIPDVLPNPAPEGISAPCMKDVRTPSTFEPLSNPIICEGVLADTALSLACQVQEALLTRDIELLRSLMKTPFTIGYWQSEGTTQSPAEAVDELDRSRLQEDTSGMTFTTDRDLFPPLFGMPPETMFGPDINVVLVVYSEGWEQNGLGAALLFFTRNDSGSYEWYGMVIAQAHFDK